MDEHNLESVCELNFADDLIENIPIGLMLLDKNGIIIRVNKKQEEASQVKKKDILGKSFAEAFSGTLNQGIRIPYLELLRNGTSFDIIIDQYTPQFYFKQITFRIRGASFKSEQYYILLNEHAEELGQEKRLVEKKGKELQESKNFLESLIDSSPNIVISTDLAHKILIFNKTAQTTFGYMEHEVMSQKIHMLFQDESFMREGVTKKLLNPKEVLCLGKNKKVFPATLRTSDINNNEGTSVGKLYLLSDLTEKRKLQERLFLTEKLALYSELMGGIAHQLNNPLIGVVNFSEMLLNEMEPEDPKKDLAVTISKAGKECLKIVNSVLHCIKEPSLTFSKIDIYKVLVASLQTFRAQSGKHLSRVSINLVWDADASQIFGDAIQLKQCFLNILSNAKQAVHNKGSIEIKSANNKTKKQIRIYFTDTGTGIPKEYLSKIFLPFVSVKKYRERHGLGLSFVYQIVKNHGGRIHVESQVGLGSTFIITLPVM